MILILARHQRSGITAIDNLLYKMTPEIAKALARTCLNH
jgi:hypothetical protein